MVAQLSLVQLIGHTQSTPYPEECEWVSLASEAWHGVGEAFPSFFKMSFLPSLSPSLPPFLPFYLSYLSICEAVSSIQTDLKLCLSAGVPGKAGVPPLLCVPGPVLSFQIRLASNSLVGKDGPEFLLLLLLPS